MRSVEPSEHKIQCAIIEWANLQKLRELGFGNFGNRTVLDYLFAIPNGGNRSITEALRLKREGVKSGVSDLFFAFPIFRCNDEFPFISKGGLWIEVKSNTGKISPSQKAWALQMECVGYKSVFVRSVEEGVQEIKDYLGVR
jgi:hypothetical protein